MSGIEGGSVALNPPLWPNELASRPSAALVWFIPHPSAFNLAEMADRPVIFISATSDLRSARDLVGKVLYSMGYEPHWEEIQAVTGGEMLEVLRGWIEKASLVVQLVGRRYGKEPPHPAAEFGRVSYTQFEALEAQRTGKKVIYFFVDDNFPSDAIDPESAELTSLQAAYRQRLVDANRLRHGPIATYVELELSIHRIRDELAELREQADRRERELIRLGVETQNKMAAIGEQSNRRHGHLVVLAVVALLELGAVGFLGLIGAATLANEMAKLSAVVATYLSPKPLAAGQTQPAPIPSEIVAKAKELVARGNAEQRAVGLIALGEHDKANEIIQELMNNPDNPVDASFRLFTMDGDNKYRANEPDKAIEPYEKAMALKPRDLQARQNLVCALVFARLGDVSAKLHRAIKIAEDSLELAPPRSSTWAGLKNLIGIAWWSLPTGDTVENLREAIAAFEAALTVYTRDAFPADWAKTHNNLGIVWWSLPTGDKVGNLMKAITAFEGALTVYTKEAYPADWAMTHNNLGIAWRDLPIGDKAEYVKRAITEFEAALTVYTKDAYPADWAMTQNNLGIAWRGLPIGDKARSVKTAIAAYEAALTVYTKKAYPAAWARTQYNLGIAWHDLPTGNKAENLTKAISAYEAALTVRTKEAYPAAWARTQVNLGAAWGSLPTGNRAENLKNAIGAYEAALSVSLSDLSPELRQSTETELSWVQLLNKDFADVLSTFARATKEGADNPALQLNRAHSLLFLGRTEEARRIYGKFVGQKIPETGKTWEQAILEDFDELAKNGLKSPEFAKIREMLKSKKAEVGSAPAAK
jgi:tetratricopeptide (TPR) repeat protein